MMAPFPLFFSALALFVVPVRSTRMRLKDVANSRGQWLKGFVLIRQWFDASWANSVELAGPPRRKLCIGIGFVGFSLGTLWCGLIIGTAIAIALATAIWLVVGAWESRRLDRDYRSLLLALDALAGDLRAGSSPQSALQRAGQNAQGMPALVLAEAANTISFGGVVSEALVESAHLCRGSARLALHKVAAAWQISAQTGAGLSTVLDRVQQDLHTRQRFSQQISAQLAGARATAVLLAALPLLGVLFGMGVGGNPFRLLLDTSIGHALLLVGVLLESAGMIWLSALIRRPLDPA